MNSCEIFEKLKFGSKATRDEMLYLKSQLLHSNSNDNLDCTVRAFGLAFPATPENVELIERYLISNTDDIVLSGVLQTLCSDSSWGLIEQYLGQLLFLISKEKAYDYSETQIAAFRILGNYLFKRDNLEVYSKLLKMFTEELAFCLENPKDHFLKGRLENIYLTLDTGLRGRKALLEHRVGKMRIPEDIKNDVLESIKRKIQKGKK